MSALDTCPGSESKGPQDGAGITSQPSTARDVSAATGKTFWRSLDDMVGTREFRDFVEREFPAYASELLDGSRRHFLKVMGASLALAGVASIPGCRRPDHRILAFNTAPEDSVPGEPLFYATAMPMPGGGCQGLLAETFDGRPTKLEGNPLHPRNKGKSTTWAQASILDLYDPDRNPALLAERGIEAKSRAAFMDFAGTHLGAYDRTDGAGLAFLVEKATSPSRDAMKARIMSRWPKAQWYVYDAIDCDNTIEGANLAFGRAVRESLDLSKANVVVSLDKDFLGGDCDLKVERDWASARYRPGTKPARAAADAEMSRLYVVETEMTLTGGAADHRMPLKSGQVAAFAVALGAALLDRLGASGGVGSLRTAFSAAGVDVNAVDSAWVGAIADDLAANRGKSVVLVGERQDPSVHALVHAMNAALGNVGQTVSYRRLDGDAGASSRTQIAQLAASAKSGGVSTLVMLGGNPVFTAPADLDFESLVKGVATTIFLGDGNETAAAVKFYVPRAHYLESWGDVQDWDGTYSVVQPMIAPLFDATSDLEFLGAIAGLENPDGYEIVRDTVANRLGASKTLAGTTGISNPAFESKWRRCLHDGMLEGSAGAAKGEAWTVRHADIARAMNGLGARTKPATLDVIFAACPKLYDGRWATNAWLQELPQQITKTSWDNPALVSRKTAQRLGLNTSRHIEGPLYNYVQVAQITVGGKSVEMPIWVQPGLADDTIVLHLGHGRRNAGRIGEGEGVDVYPLRTTKGMRVASAESMTPAKGRAPFKIANTQDHWALEGRDVFREIDLSWWRQSGDDILETVDAYGDTRHLDGAERLGILSHAPVSKNIYKNKKDVRGGSIYYHKVDEQGNPVLDKDGRFQSPDNKFGKPIQQWGMSIDLTTCTGCGACTVACQAENNIPVVGKAEVAKGREMHWIRVDRYYSSEKMDESAFVNPDMVVQPVPCMHCEQAPCEVVCPVSATTHGFQGTNDMAYNRCIGTRYCSNNCPYKVRRFNFFDYGTKLLDGKSSLDAVLPKDVNKNMIPPRLRQKDTEVGSMQHNPHVTVRSRGVMEKCTYCIQRVNKARMETKLSDLKYVPDGFFQAACQQACPTDSIVFGDIYDYVSNDGKGSRVYQAKRDPRTFAMLSYLNTIPRTTFQLRVRNPNERLRPPGPNPFEHHGAGHDDVLDGEFPHGHDHEATDHEEGHVMSLPVLSNAGVSA